MSQDVILGLRDSAIYTFKHDSIEAFVVQNVINPFSRSFKFHCIYH